MIEQSSIAVAMSEGVTSSTLASMSQLWAQTQLASMTVFPYAAELTPRLHQIRAENGISAAAAASNTVYPRSRG